jgi:hypothetical protein
VNDPSHTIAHLIMIALAPIMILLPLAVALLVPGRLASDAERTRLRARFVPLVIAASLVNRERQSPVTRGMWMLAIAACLAGPIAIGARGFWLFPMPTGEAARPFMESTDHLVWSLFLVLSALALVELLVLPRILRSMLLEPEPMDAAGSAELAVLYARQRRRRVLGMFWLMGVAAPLFMSSLYALITWFPADGATLGIIGGVGGSLLGLVGAVFGMTMSAERMKIAEVRARLERSGTAVQS